MAQSKTLAVEDHHHSGHLGPLLLHHQLEQGEDPGEEVKEGHLGKKVKEGNLGGKVKEGDNLGGKHTNWENYDCSCGPPVAATGQV